MKWFVEAIMKQLGVNEESARVVFAEISQNFEGYFSELTKNQVKRLIADHAYVLNACGAANDALYAKCTLEAGHDGEHYDRNIDVGFEMVA